MQQATYDQLPEDVRAQLDKVTIDSNVPAGQVQVTMPVEEFIRQVRKATPGAFGGKNRRRRSGR